MSSGGSGALLLLLLLLFNLKGILILLMSLNAIASTFYDFIDDFLVSILVRIGFFLIEALLSALEITILGLLVLYFSSGLIISSSIIG